MNVVGMDCLKEIRNISTMPVIKQTVVKYATLKWLLNQTCKFQEGISAVEEIHNWDDNNTFQFVFRDKRVQRDHHEPSENQKVQDSFR